MNGLGIEEFYAGDRFEGLFSYGVRKSGVYYYSNGDRYAGD